MYAATDYPHKRYRQVVPEWTVCETCDRKLKTKDWRSHEAGKEHREAVSRAKELEKSLNNTHSENGSAQPDLDDPGFRPSSPVMPPPSGDGCHNCGQPGHFARECTEPRKPRQGGGGSGGCFNCGRDGHMSRDCTEPRKPREGAGRGGRACHNCGLEGHISRECPEPRVQRCRNCDEPGHMAKECPKPKDWSRVKCSNCGQMGHGVKRCDQPVKESSIDEWNIGDNNNETIITQGGWETGTSGVDTVNSWDNPDLIIDTTNSSGADTFLPQAGGDGW